MQPCLLYEFVEANVRWAWLWEREWQVYFVLNGLVVGKVGKRFMDDVMAHPEDVWNQYKIPVGQVDAVLAQMMLLHQCVRCMVDPKFYKDEV